MNEIVFNAPINSLSFGNVSYNLLREMWKRDMKVNFFPVGTNIAFDTFNKIEKDFLDWFNSSLNNRIKNVRRDHPSLKLWHLNGATERVTRSQSLFTFYELDQPTREEVSMINLQDKVFVSSSYTKEIMTLAGIDPSQVTFVPLGLDEDFTVPDQPKISETINFSLMGKWEKRKHTAEIIKLWAEKYGDNPSYHLNCLVNNPHMKAEHVNALIANALGNRRYFNINFIPHLETNTHINNFINRMDIDLTGLSGAEGWNLPAFNSVALGNYAIVLNATAHKDWATKENSILIESNGKTSAVDGIFFKEGESFNQGRIFTWDRDEVAEAMDTAINKVKESRINTEGLKLKDKFTYSKTLDTILNNL